MTAKASSLRFRQDGSFTIVQLADVHWHNGEPEDLRSRRLIERILDAERPDLVALTGDIVGGYDSRDPADAYRQVVAPIEARAIPWASVFGNHDDEGNLSRLDLLAVKQSCAWCLTERGPEDVTGVGNYVLRVRSREDDSLAAALYWLDSGSYNSHGVGDYAWIAWDQIAWYRAASRTLAAERVPAGRARHPLARGRAKLRDLVAPGRRLHRQRPTRARTEGTRPQRGVSTRACPIDPRHGTSAEAEVQNKRQHPVGT